MTGHIFLSYSHESDSEYVERLAKHLDEQGITVWFDREIISGDRWASVIRDRIDSCAAFVVVMSPAAEESTWVNREINHAEHRQRPIIPLLLRGDRFFRLSDVQYEDVTAGDMPPARFTSRLQAYQKAQQTQPLPSHADTLMRQHDDAEALFSRGEYAGAVQLLQHVVTGRIQALGADHLDTLQSRHLLAHAIGASGNPAHAVPLLRDLLADQIRVLGADHPDTLQTRYRLAYHVRPPGDWAQAAKLVRDVLADQVRVLGADHPDILPTRYLLAFYIGASGVPGDVAQAVALFRDLLAAQIRMLGADHPDTLQTRRQLAYHIGAAGDWPQAVKLVREVLADQVRVLGHGHLDTQRTRALLNSKVHLARAAEPDDSSVGYGVDG